jgi:hypothetical protein
MRRLWGLINPITIFIVGVIVGVLGDAGVGASMIMLGWGVWIFIGVLFFFGIIQSRGVLRPKSISSSPVEIVSLDEYSKWKEGQ